MPRRTYNPRRGRPRPIGAANPESLAELAAALQRIAQRRSENENPDRRTTP